MALLMSFGAFVLGASPLAQGGPGPKPEPRPIEAGEFVVLEGFVLEPDGSPAEGSLVVSSAGGRASADRSGFYRLEARVPSEAQGVQVTGVGRAQGTASTFVELTAPRGVLQVGPLVLSQGLVCQPSWLPTFGGQPGTGDTVLSLVVFDDGGGPALYAGGTFTTSGGVAANRVARWDGASWSALGSGVDGEVRALSVFDDGGGPALFVAGDFDTAGGVAANNVAKWDGSSWSALGSGISGAVDSLVVFEDGGGPALFAGGGFNSAGGSPANSIAKWDGSSWSTLGTGVNGGVRALAVFDDGGGVALYAGGFFTNAGGITARRIAKWSGTSWSALGSGLLGGSQGVRALAVFDDGSGSALYVGSDCTFAGGVEAHSIARWNGSAWSAVGGGLNSIVRALTVFDDGNGPGLYASGGFTSVGGEVVNHIARWNGTSWSAAGSGANSSIGALSVFDDGGGSALFAGGSFTVAGGVAANSIARWSGASWSALGDGINAAVYDLATFDDGSGPALYAAGHLSSADGVTVNHVARWDGASWSALGSGTNGNVVYALAVFDDGSGPALYAGGDFSTAGGVPANHVAKWDGASWSALGSGVGCPLVPTCAVGVMEVFDDGSGPALYVGGGFSTAGGSSANNIAKWDGASWTALGSGADGSVQALLVFDDGGGPALYVGGSFGAAGGVSAESIARWDGSSWTALGGGLDGSVNAMTAFDDGGGPSLYVGGTFTSAGGAPANAIARWKDSSWSTLGSGFAGGSFGTYVSSLTAFDDGGGPELHAGGNFTTASGLSANRIARWDGSTWSPLGSGTNGTVTALQGFDDGSGPALFAGGEFGSAFDSGDSCLAKWSGCPDSAAPVIACPVRVLVGDELSGPPGRVVHFTVTATDNLDPAPSVVCVPPSGSLFARGTTIVTCTATDALGNQATRQFPVQVEARLRPGSR